MKHYSLLFLFLSIIATGFCQNATLNKPNGTIISTKAVTPLSKTQQGFQLPAITYAQRNAIVSPTAGLVIYCKDCGSSGGEPQYYNGTTWLNMIGGPSLTGPTVITTPEVVVVLPPSNLAVGDTWGGGKVFYILQPGDVGYSATAIHGLIAAPSDQSAGISWLTNNNAIGNIVTTANATSLGIGTGLANTNAIVSFNGAGNYATQLCSDLALNGFTDWYLPSKDELNKLFLSKDLIGGFSNFYYWSSSENHENYTLQVWAQYFAFPDARLFGTNQLYRVRAVRSF